MVSKKTKALVVYYTKTGNTEKVARAIAKGLKKKANVAVKKASGFKPDEVKDYSIVGFGSGVYALKFSKQIIKKIKKITGSKTKRFFLFSTSGAGMSGFGKPKRILEEKGFKFLGGFSCKGFDAFGPLKLIGGINKGRPNEEDLKKAEEFGRNLVLSRNIYKYK